MEKRQMDRPSGFSDSEDVSWKISRKVAHGHQKFLTDCQTM